MKTAVFGHDSGGDGPTAACGAPSLTFTPPAALAPGHPRRAAATAGASGANSARPHPRRTSRMQNVGCNPPIIYPIKGIDSLILENVGSC
ncbi:unnamed protein product [Angiostrongylus costaricensis]|uniref:Uncharacterized protein n=1 Tax=Angiostrongylus costaricensis TaxID=334426 RepID=A0A0R3PTD3_ANGCS|nr:unnamed protein product [Angiostrongylus costaricensis]